MFAVDYRSFAHKIKRRIRFHESAFKILTICIVFIVVGFVFVVDPLSAPSGL